VPKSLTRSHRIDTNPPAVAAPAPQSPASVLSADSMRSLPMNDMFYQAAPSNGYADVSALFDSTSPPQPIPSTSSHPMPNLASLDPTLPVDSLMQDLVASDSYNTSPLPELWDTSLFDFGQLFRSSDVDPYLVNFQDPLDEVCAVVSPFDRLAAIWPTRPSRRSQEIKPTDWIDPRTRTQRSLLVHAPTLARMHRHLSGGGIPFRRQLPRAVRALQARRAGLKMGAGHVQRAAPALL
jgi:hypothetical protein